MSLLECYLCVVTYTYHLDIVVMLVILFIAQLKIKDKAIFYKNVLFQNNKYEKDAQILQKLLFLQ